MAKWNRAGSVRKANQANCNHWSDKRAGYLVRVWYAPWLERFKVVCICGIIWYEKEPIRCEMELTF